MITWLIIESKLNNQPIMVVTHWYFNHLITCFLILFPFYTLIPWVFIPYKCFHKNRPSWNISQHLEKATSLMENSTLTFKTLKSSTCKVDKNLKIEDAKLRAHLSIHGQPYQNSKALQLLWMWFQEVNFKFLRKTRHQFPSS